MSRTVTIYQCWNAEDMAQSDKWWPTLNLAKDHISETYQIPRSRIVLDDNGYWEGEDGDGFECYVQRYDIRLTAASICDALTTYPNR